MDSTLLIINYHNNLILMHLIILIIVMRESINREKEHTFSYNNGCI